jgi:hypothetical protein
MDYLRCGAVVAGLALIASVVATVGLISETVEVHPKLEGVPAEALWSLQETKYKPLAPLTALAGFGLFTAALLRIRAPQKRN